MLTTKSQQLINKGGLPTAMHQFTTGRLIGNSLTVIYT